MHPSADGPQLLPSPRPSQGPGRRATARGGRSWEELGWSRAGGGSGLTLAALEE